jgi:hypothetical protein
MTSEPLTTPIASSHWPSRTQRVEDRRNAELRRRDPVAVRTRQVADADMVGQHDHAQAIAERLAFGARDGENALELGGAARHQPDQPLGLPDADLPALEGAEPLQLGPELVEKRSERGEGLTLIDKHEVSSFSNQ